MRPVTFILQCALFTPLLGLSLSQYTVAPPHAWDEHWDQGHHSLWKERQEGSPGERAAAGMETTKTCMFRNIPTKKAFAASFPRASQSFPLPATDIANLVCLLGKEATPFPEITSVFHSELNECFRIEATAPECSSPSICTQALPSSLL